MLAPLCLFVYNRPQHTLRTLEGLKKNPEAKNSILYVYSDGVKNPEQLSAVESVRQILRNLQGFKEVHLIEREGNFGLAANIIDGVTTVLQKHETIIVLEDDLYSSPYFLKFMNEALEKYKQDPRVCCLNGYCYPLKRQMNTPFFLRGADCWGWGTWRDKWTWFEKDGSLLMRRLREKNLNHAFDLDGAYSYTDMLQNQIDGKNNSWAVRWHASLFLANKLTLYPPQSLIQNFGFDATGVHCAEAEMFDVNLATVPITLSTVPVEESPLARRELIRFFRSAQSSWKDYAPEPAKKVWRFMKKLRNR